MSLRLGLFAYGYGFGLAALVSLTMAIYYLNSRLRDLHFWTFTRQPFPEPVLILDDQDEEEPVEEQIADEPETGPTPA